MHNIKSMEEFLGILAALQNHGRLYHLKPAVANKAKPAITYATIRDSMLALPTGDLWDPNEIKALERFGNKIKTSSYMGASDRYEHVQFSEAFKEAESYYKAHTKEVNAFVLSKHSEWTKPLTTTEKAKFLFRGITVVNKYAFRVVYPSIDILMAMTHPELHIYEGTNDMILLDPTKHEVQEVRLTEQLKEAAQSITVNRFLQLFLRSERPNGNPGYVSMGRTNDRAAQNYELAFEIFHMKATPGEIEIGKKISRDLQATGGGCSARHDNIVRLHVIPWVAEAPEKHIGDSDPYKEVARVLLQDPDALAPYMEWLNKKQAKLLK